jgi:drug/metabolite transporter (DMT)-like permease
LPAVTASIGALMVPVLGVIGSIVFLGNKPTINDIAGFVLIFCAAACVLLQPSVKHMDVPE